MLKKILHRLMHSASHSSHRRHYSSSDRRHYKRYSSSDYQKRHHGGYVGKLSSSDLKYGHSRHGHGYYKNRHRSFSSS
ncbi:hypothetical protein [Paenibacillus jiagnxiensis]|uniref:hypothetical protein n=1 Tax=Paenibacillus jiagnxiensis TaxID=3228926 RepID=UPI0033ACB949